MDNRWVVYLHFIVSPRKLFEKKKAKENVSKNQKKEALISYIHKTEQWFGVFFRSVKIQIQSDPNEPCALMSDPNEPC